MVIDNELLKECQDGSRRACNQLYEKLFSFLMNICIRYNNDYDKAGDVLNAVFLKVIQNLDKRDPTKQFLGWVKAIAMNHLADEFRKQKRYTEKFFLSDDLVSFEKAGSDISMGGLEVQDLIKMVQSLPPACNRIFNLYAIDGYSHKEIGEMLGISEGTSKSQLHLARHKLQEMLKEEQKTLKKINFERTG